MSISTSFGKKRGTNVAEATSKGIPSVFLAVCRPVMGVLNRMCSVCVDVLRVGRPSDPAQIILLTLAINYVSEVSWWKKHGVRARTEACVVAACRLQPAPLCVIESEIAVFLALEGLKVAVTLFTLEQSPFWFTSTSRVRV